MDGNGIDWWQAAAVAATVVASLVAIIQLRILSTQQAREETALVTELSQQWSELSTAWGYLVLAGRGPEDYYNVLDTSHIDDMLTPRTTLSRPPRHLGDVRSALAFVASVSAHVLGGRVSVEAVYPVFGSEWLRHGVAIRTLVDPGIPPPLSDSESECGHLTSSAREWCVYHPGIARRTWILLDLMWAEAARLGDLAPAELLTAARAKRAVSALAPSRTRLDEEARRVAPRSRWLRYRLKAHLRHAEFKHGVTRRGLDEADLAVADKVWVRALIQGIAVGSDGGGSAAYEAAKPH